MPAQQTIRRKLIAAIMSTSVIVLVLACAAFITYEVISFRRQVVMGLTTRAELVAANSTAALAFNNKEDATQVLAAFKKDPRMVAASLYDTKGQLFASYPAVAPAGMFPERPERQGYRFEEGYFSIFVPVTQDNRWLGTVYLKFSTSVLAERYRVYSILVLITIAGAVLIAFALSTRLQRRIGGPILSLADTARQVSESKDYSLRARKFTDDEIGVLTDSFNEMLQEIQQRESSLRQREAQMRAILTSALDAIITMNHEGRIVEFNPAAETMFGYGRSEAIGAILADLIIPPSLRDKHKLGMSYYLAPGEGPVLGKRLELMALRSDGSEFPAELAITRIVQEGSPMFTGFIRDITERKRAEKAMTLLAAIVKTSDDAIISKDLNGHILSWNHGAERIFGYTATEAIGRSIEMLIPPERRHEEVEILGKIRRGESLEHFETVRVRKDGTLINISVTLSPIKDAEGRIVGASKIARDVTAAIHAREEIRRLNAELEHRVVERTAQLESSNKELEAFSYSVSHDLRAPLRAVDGFSKAVLENYGDKLDEEGRRLLGRVRLASQRMAQLIDDLLKLSRITRVEMRAESVDLSSMAQQIVTELKQSQPERRVECVIAPGVTVRGDPHLLHIMLENLFRNAWKYTSKHPTATIEFGGTRQNGEHVFFVRDDGAGFDMAYTNLLFAPFQRLHRQTDFEGTGVGLATVQRVIRRHGGRVWAEGAVEKGATFYFTLEKG